MFGDKIKKAIQKKGISQYRAAKELGIGFSRLNQYVNNARHPDYDMIHQLCSYLNITPNYLFGVPELPQIQKEKLIHIFVDVEDWLKKNDYVLEPEEKIKLVFALYDEFAVTPSVIKDNNVIDITSFIKNREKVG